MKSSTLTPCWLTKLAAVVVLALGPIESEATTVVPPDFTVLVNGSDYIVRGVTKSVHAVKRTGPQGTRIVTLVELEVTEKVAGEPPPAVILELLGGQVGDEGMSVEGMPRFQVGDEDILFVSGNGRTICPLNSMMYGRYAVVVDQSTGRSHVARADGSPLPSVGEVSVAMTEDNAAGAVRRAVASAQSMGPEEFIRQIRAAVKPGSHLQSAK